MVRGRKNAPQWCHGVRSGTLQARPVLDDFMGKLAGFQRSIIDLLIVGRWHGFCYSPGELVAPLGIAQRSIPPFHLGDTNGKDRRRRNGDG
jgi:hypothetical protein